MTCGIFSLGKCVPQKTLHKGAILTLAAAGSEMSNSCVITNVETNEKRGYGCSCNRMDFAVENPELTYTVSPYQTACGIVDIAMHTIERYFCPGEDTYLTDAIAEAVIKNVMKAGKDCLADPENYEARANMMWASSLAHNGLTGCGRKTQLVVHQLEHEVSECIHRWHTELAWQHSGAVGHVMYTRQTSTAGYSMHRMYGM